MLSSLSQCLRAWPGRRCGLAAAVAALLLLGAAPAGPAAAVELPAGITLPDGLVAAPGQVTDDTSLQLLAAVTAVGELEAIPAALHVRLAPGWKTYWRSPGDAGYPVSVDWTGSRNLSSAELAWPAPHRFTLFGLDTFGYENEVVFPVTVSPERAGEPVHLQALVRYLVCRDVCIPGEASLTLDLPAGPATPSASSQLIDRFAVQVPDDGAAHGLGLERVAVGGRADEPTLEVTARSEFSFRAPDLLVEGPPGLHFAAPVVRLSDGDTVARFSVPVSVEDDAPPLAGAELTLTLVDQSAGGRRGLERSVVPAPPAQSSGGGLFAFLGLALLGGLILNLMPCVLPVLSLKLLGVVGHGGGEARAVRASFLASAAGVIAAFLALAAALAFVKSAGMAVGWGIQFQQPLFLVAMLLLLTLFACNLWGWFEIPLPGWLGNMALRHGGGPGGDQGLVGHFATGAFATLLATPCSAPFLGTAVGFALTGTTAELFAVFAALGIGLALPYLLVAALPGLATRLPRPGRWIIWLRGLLGLALAGTAAWLLTVLAAQLDGQSALVAGLLLLAIAAALWLSRRLAIPRTGWAAVAACTVALLALAAAPPSAAPPPVSSAALWQRFDERAIGGLVRDGKVVVVDVTADWCITCQVNEKLVLGDADVAARLSSPGVVAMQADWTRPDAAIARYLASFGRYGIPFNAVYGPGSPDGIVLPELLSKADVEGALDRAAAGAGLAAVSAEDIE